MKVVLLFTTIVILFTGCSNKAAEGEQNKIIRSVDSNEFQSLMAEEIDPVVIDVRTAGEFGRGHIANAMNINLYDPSFNEKLEVLDKENKVFVYCQAGLRSAEAAKIMSEKGFKSIIELKEGLGAWQKKGKPVAR